MTKILLIGCGNMGFALLRGWMASPQRPEVVVIEPTDALRARAAAEGAVAVCASGDIPAGFTPDVVLFAVKPQVIRSILSDYAWMTGACFVSIAAGVTIASLAEGLGDVAIMRCMPNTPASVGKGVFGCYANARMSPAQSAMVGDLLAVSGSVFVLPDETMIDSITAVSGSGPAYLFLFIEAMSAAARSVGLPDDIASDIARQTVFGAAALAEVSPDDAAQLRRNVTSPKGTTAAALDVLMGDDGMAALIGKAVQAAFDRARELGRVA